MHPSLDSYSIGTKAGTVPVAPPPQEETPELFVSPLSSSATEDANSLDAWWWQETPEAQQDLAHVLEVRSQLSLMLQQEGPLTPTDSAASANAKAETPNAGAANDAVHANGASNTTANKEEDLSLETLLHSYLQLLEELLGAPNVPQPHPEQPQPLVCSLHWTTNEENVIAHDLQEERRLVLAVLATHYAQQGAQAAAVAATTSNQEASAASLLRTQWLDASKRFTKAASVARAANDSSSHLMWMAQAQRAAYQSYCVQKGTPKHHLLAKMSMGAVRLLEQALDAASSSERAATVDTSELQRLVSHMRATAEEHQAQVSLNKQDFATAVARYQRAIFHSSAAVAAVQQTDDSQQQQQHEHLQICLAEAEAALAKAETTADSPVLEDPWSLPDVASQVVVKVPEFCSLQQTTTAQPQLWTTVVRRNVPLQAAVQQFCATRTKWVWETATWAEEHSNQARDSLYEWHLPQALQHYHHQQQQAANADDASSTGGKSAIWQAVDAYQHGQAERLQARLWDLQECAATARKTHQTNREMLDTNVAQTREFAKQHATFTAPLVEQEQADLRREWLEHTVLLQRTATSDTRLLERFERLCEKFKLLEQMDRDSEQASTMSLSSTSSEQGIVVVDTTELTLSLAELSRLFDEREDLVARLKDEASLYQIVPELWRVHQEQGEEAYETVVQEACGELCQDILAQLRQGMDRQTELMETIQAQNDDFVKARDESKKNDSESVLSAMEEALVEVERISEHIKEGLAFYQNIERLKEDIEQLSTRLIVERYEFEERSRRLRQEEEDARMASRMLEENHQTTTPDRSSFTVQVRPGAEPVSPELSADLVVDDEKMAKLLDMGFDPDQAYDALMKFENQLGTALRHLLPTGSY